VRIIKIIAAALFLAAVPWAMWYNLNYDRYGTIDRPAPPVFIQVVTVDAGVFNNTLKSKAAEYANRNHGVRLFVLPMNAEQITLYDFDIRIIRDGGELYAFISPTQTKEAAGHCQRFLEYLLNSGTSINVIP